MTTKDQNDVKPPLTPDEAPEGEVVGTALTAEPAGYAVYDNALQRFVTGVHDEETATEIAKRVAGETTTDLGLDEDEVAGRFEVRAV